MGALIGLILFLSCISLSAQPSYLNNVKATIAVEAKKNGVIFRESSTLVGNFNDINVYKVDVSEVLSGKAYSAVMLTQGPHKTSDLLIDLDEIRQIVAVFELFRGGKLTGGTNWITTNSGVSVEFVNRNGIWEASMSPLSGPTIGSSKKIIERGEVDKFIQLLTSALEIKK